MKYRNIRVLVARSISAIEDPRGACDDVRECDTVKDAKVFARHALTNAYQTSGEFSEPMNVARVMADEPDGRTVCLADYWRKGWQPEIKLTEGSELAELNEMDAKHPGWDRERGDIAQ